jgi:hypothetical protein
MWQITYDLNRERTLIFVGGGRDAPPNPEREYGMGVACGRERDAAAVQRLLGVPQIASRLGSCRIGGSTIPTVKEGDIAVVVELAREVFVPAAPANSPTRG